MNPAEVSFKDGRTSFLAWFKGVRDWFPEESFEADVFPTVKVAAEYWEPRRPGAEAFRPNEQPEKPGKIKWMSPVSRTPIYLESEEAIKKESTEAIIKILRYHPTPYSNEAIVQLIGQKTGIRVLPEQVESIRRRDTRWSLDAKQKRWVTLRAEKEAKEAQKRNEQLLKMALDRARKAFEDSIKYCPDSLTEFRWAIVLKILSKFYCSVWITGRFVIAMEFVDELIKPDLMDAIVREATPRLKLKCQWLNGFEPDVSMKLVKSETPGSTWMRFVLTPSA